ncbi:MAG: hypothetical protein ACP6IS_12795, partial [Candidatus Asgardarchaeia archaeon]
MRVTGLFYQVKIAIGEARSRAPKLIFLGLVVFSLLYAEFMGAYTSPMTPIVGLTFFVDTRGNEVDNALGRLTVTDMAHFVVRGSGYYRYRVMDSQGVVILSGFGVFNGSGYADIHFLLSPNEFKIGESYRLEIFAVDEPLPMLFKYGRVTKGFEVSKEITRVSIGFYRNPATNKTVVFAKLTDEVNPIFGRRIDFYWKHYGTNERFSYLGSGVTDSAGVAQVPLDVKDGRLILIKAEFVGDSLYEPSAVDEIYSEVVNGHELTISKGVIPRKGTTLNKEQVAKDTIKDSASISDKRSSHVFTSLNVALKSNDQDGVSVDNRQVKTADDVPKVHFYNGDVESMDLIEFLDNLTKDGTPASMLVDIAEILNNLDDLPYVVWKLGIIFSKLDVSLIPAVDNGNIILYKVHVYEVVKNVAKTITKTVTVTTTEWVKRTETVYKQVKDKIKELIKLVKWVKEKRTQTITYWNPLTWRWETIKQVYYVWVQKIQWKVVWKTVTKTVKVTKVYWEKVTTTTTKTITLTVYEKVRKTVRENVKAYIIDVQNLKVIDESTGESKRLDEWILSLVGIDSNVLKKTTGYLLEKTIGPALNVINSVVDFLVSWAKRFLKDLADSFLDYVFSLVISSAAKESLKCSMNSYKDKSSHTDYMYNGFYSMNRFLAKEHNGKIKLSTATA